MIFGIKNIFYSLLASQDGGINRSLGPLSPRGLKSVPRPLGIGVKTNPERPDTL